MGCVPLFNSCSSASVLDGASIVVALTDLESDHFTDNSAVVYVGHNTPDGPVGEIHEIKLAALDRFTGAQDNNFGGYTVAGALSPEAVGNGMEIITREAVFLNALENPAYANISPIDATGFFDENDVSGAMKIYSQYMNDKTNAAESYLGVMERISQDPEYITFMAHNIPNIASMQFDEFQEEWDNLSGFANANVGYAEHLENAGEHRGIIVESLKTLDEGISLSAFEKETFLQKMGVESSGEPLVSNQPSVNNDGLGLH